MGDILVRHDTESHYTVIFDRKTGMFLRQGDTEEEPFWNRRGPELLDISITNYCEKGCSFCYRASHPGGVHMSLEEYCRLMEQAEKAGVLQAALGGGNPNQHPDFIRILEETRSHGIIPSYTTNGQGMTEEIYHATQKYCGAVAVSLYDNIREVKGVIENCKKYDIKVNIHFLLNQETVEKALCFLQTEKELLKQVNAVVFLNYKPIHSPAEWCLEENEIFLKLLQAVETLEACKIGFDSCMISYLTLLEPEIAWETAEFCEAARFSAFISEDSLLYPCSFMKDTSIQGIDLKKITLQEGWQNGKAFLKMREALRTPGNQRYPISGCKACNHYEFCHGGCQIFDINRCRRKGHVG